MRWMWMVAACVFAAGCNEGGSVAEVAGKVTYQGSAVASGTVNFLMRERGLAAAAPVDSSGAFRVPGEMEPGRYAVYVTPPAPEPSMPGQKRSAPPKSSIPKAARDPSTSGLEVSINEGENDLTIELRE